MDVEHIDDISLGLYASRNLYLPRTTVDKIRHHLRTCDKCRKRLYEKLKSEVDNEDSGDGHSLSTGAASPAGALGVFTTLEHVLGK